MCESNQIKLTVSRDSEFPVITGVGKNEDRSNGLNKVIYQRLQEAVQVQNSLIFFKIFAMGKIFQQASNNNYYYDNGK